MCIYIYIYIYIYQVLLDKLYQMGLISNPQSLEEPATRDSAATGSSSVGGCV